MLRDMRVSLDMIPGLASLTRATLAYFRFGGIADMVGLAGGLTHREWTPSKHAGTARSYPAAGCRMPVLMFL